MASLQKYLDELDNKFADLQLINRDFYRDKIGVISFSKKALIKGKHGDWSEEYIRARFVWALVNSAKYNKEYICVEFGFPKGNGAKSLNPDIAKEYYNKIAKHHLNA
jgi:type I restriction enzyme M protein